MNLSRIFLFLYVYSTLNVAAKSLADLSLLYPTDKGPSGHNYVALYEKYFNSLQHQSIKFLEIGFYHGDSARLWDNYFTQANLFFIDINPTLFQQYGHTLSTRCSYHVVDQGKQTDLLKFIKDVGGEFDIIIDDGGHLMHQQIISFKTLFPYLKPGGLYIIEDLHTSYWQSYGGSGSMAQPKINPNTTIYFLQQLINDVNFIGATTGSADVIKCSSALTQKLSYYQKHIKSIHFYNSICFIEKQ